ncbi:K02A2.6-like, partial [Cordylochernes scorpioides]
MSKSKRQAGQKEAELAQENKSVIDALTAMMKSLGRDAPAAAARFDGSSSAESFLRELERSPEFQNSSCDERSRMVVAALGEPRRTLQSMNYLYEPYWRIKQVLEDLYPPPETPTHQEFYQLRCGPQGLQEYYLQKVRIGTQLNIDRKEMVNALTQGMPSYSRNLLLIATPSSPSEWLTLARRFYGIGGDPSRPGISSPTESPSPRQSGRQTSNPLRRLSEDVPHSQKRPEGSPSTPLTPCKHCQGPHWNNQCPQRSTLPGQLADHPRLSTPPRYFRDPRDSTTKENIGLFLIDKFSVPALNIDPVKIIPNSDKIITLRPYRIPYSDYPEIKYQIEKMLENEIIEPSNSPYAVPVTLARKRDGSKRFCVDFRKLNELMSVDNYPIPLIETVLDQLSNSKYFSTINITSAFWQIPIHPESRPLLSFVTNLGQYHFNRLPFGLKLSPQIFERQLNQLIQKHKLTFTNHYFDDFIIHSNSLEAHLGHLQEFFHFCKLENIKFNLNKCQFFKTSIDYLGYKISSGTCTPLVRNIDVINAIKPPTNVKTLQSFLGAINVYKKFIPDYARIRNSLNQLLKRNVKWEWTSDCQKAFDKLKQLLSSGPILHLYKSDLPCQVYSDAHLQGIGGVLKQLHPDGNSYSVQYYSRTLRKYERNYTITELECLAKIETVDRFKVYLAGNCFTIFTDHCALQWLKNIKNPTGRLFRWSLRLSVYDYQNCNICQMSKTPKGPKYGELGELPESPLPFDLVSMDTIAGFSRYGSAKNYLHVVVDHATRFAWTFPSRSTSTTTYIQVIKKVLQSGCPRRLLTDRAPAFTSPRFRRFLISHNIQPMLTTSNHPQANSLSERLNATLTGKLRLLHLQHPRASWTMLQSKVVKAYNDTPHSVTGFPPSYLMDGSLPKELSQHLDPYPSVTESRRLALQRTKERHKLDKIRFDKNHRSPDFEVGDLVLTKIYQHPNTGKLVPYFSGPYEIIEVISPYTVRINRPNQAQNLETEIIHVNKLKHYSEDTKYIFTPHSTNNNSKPKSYFIYNHFPPEIFHDDYKNYASTLSNPFNHMNPDIFLDDDEQTLTARYISTPDTIPKIAIRLEPSPTTKIMLPSSPTRNHTPQISPQLRALLINCGNTKLENSEEVHRALNPESTTPEPSSLKEIIREEIEKSVAAISKPTTTSQYVLIAAAQAMFSDSVKNADNGRRDPKDMHQAPKNLKWIYRNFAEKSAPLHEVLKKDNKFKWNSDQQDAFDSSKKALRSEPVLAYFEEQLPTELHTDASGYGIGAVLVQINDGKERPVGYASRTLSMAEKNCSTTERECLAAIWAINKFRPYLFGRKFVIVTDHHALCWLSNLKGPTGRVARWALKLQEYNVMVVYKSGRKHQDADCLSRNPLQLESEEAYNDEDDDIPSITVLTLTHREAKEAAKFLLEDVVMKHGAPREIITDRGRVFQPKLIAQLTNQCSSIHRFTTAYHPQTNGLTERSNKTLANMIVMYVSVEQKDWDVILPYVTFAYNTAKQDTTGFTPFKLIHGREAETTVDTLFPNPHEDLQEDYSQKIASRVEETRQLARLETLKAREKDKARYDSKHEPMDYNVGDLVWIFIPIRKVGLSEKLMKRYFGPYRVTRKLSDVTFEVEPVDQPTRRRQTRDLVHVLRMKPYHDPEDQADLF